MRLRSACVYRLHNHFSLTAGALTINTSGSQRRYTISKQYRTRFIGLHTRKIRRRASKRQMASSRHDLHDHGTAHVWMYVPSKYHGLPYVYYMYIRMARIHTFTRSLTIKKAQQVIVALFGKHYTTKKKGRVEASDGPTSMPNGYEKKTFV